MDPLTIRKTQESDTGWRFIVEVGTHEETRIGFGVSVDKEYWQQLTLGKFPPERLLRESFRYLLAKQNKTSVLRDFGNDFTLRNIQTLFYSYERRMKMALFGTEYPEKVANQ